MNEGIYYLRVNGTVEGPYTIGQIYDLWAQRKINSQTAFARFDDMENWQPLSELTLKISSPKAAHAKQPAPPGPAPPQPPTTARAKSAAVPAFVSEGFPTLLQQEQGSVRSHRGGADAIETFKQIAGQPQFAAGISIVIGVGLILYFAFLYPFAGSSSESAQEIAILKQTGVLTGVGFLLLAGLLLVAQQLARLHATLQSKETKSGSNSNRNSL